MKIAVIALGSRGDVEPYLALGVGLGGAGHTVRLVTHENFAALVQACGLEFWPVAGDSQEVAQSAAMRDLLEKGNFLAILSHMAKEAERGALALAEGGQVACQGVDLIVAGIGGLFVGLALAEKFKLPLVQAYYIPFTPTRAFASFLAPGLPGWLGPAPRWLSHHLARQVMWRSFRAADSAARRQLLQLPAAPFWGPYHSDRLQGTPILYGYSPAVIPRPSDWGDEVCVTGYWFLEPSDDWQPSPALQRFLDDGPPPVYVGFGSMSTRNPEETADLVLKALARTGQRGILLGGWGGLRKAELPASVLMIDSAPFTWLFPRMAAVVHHGGAGTTAAGLRAGVPTLVVPFFGDQPYWAQRVYDLGVGPRSIPRKRLTADRLAAAIEQAVTDGPMRRRAEELGATIRAEAGVDHAVAVIGRFAGLR